MMFEINVRGNIISVQETEPITSGSVAVYKCGFLFDSAWEGFFRSAVFRVGSMMRTVPLDSEDSCDIPWELLVKKNIGLPVEVSVYGTKDGVEILPTIWDKLGRVRAGSEPGEDVKDPTPSTYDRLASLVREYGDKVTDELDAVRKTAREAETVANAVSETVSNIVGSVESTAASAAEAAASALEAKTSAEGAKDYADRAEAAAEAAEGVESFNGRIGAVVPESGDYTHDMVGADAVGAAAAALASANAYADGIKPTKVSDLINDSGFLTSYTETDPTVPDWAKAETKPTYTYDEVGAAPAGYGLGDQCVYPTDYDWNNAVENGWYSGKVNTPDNGWYFGTVVRINGDQEPIIVQTAYDQFSSTNLYQATKVKRVGAYTSSTDPTIVWDEWEFVNPPMTLGKEYRTTERYLGKPVYTQLIEFDFATPGTVCLTEVAATTDGVLVRFFAKLDGWSLPTGSYGGNYNDAGFIACSCRATTISLNVYTYTKTRDLTAKTGTAQFWYTKSE